MEGDDMNRLIDVAPAFGCPLDDPQVGTRYVLTAPVALKKTDVWSSHQPSTPTGIQHEENNSTIRENAECVSRSNT
jgi:hypothetical protein